MAQLNDELRAVVHDVVRLTPNIVEVIVRAPIAARAFQPGQFYRLQNYETLAPRTEDTVLGHGRTRAHRRLGGSRERAAFDHRARDGRLVGSVRAAETGRAGDPDGSDRNADRNAGGKRFCWPAADWATRCCSPSGRSCAQKDRASSTSPDTRRSSTATKWKRSKRPPISWSGSAMKRPDSRPAACRTGRSSATSWKRWWLTARGELGERRDSAAARWIA